VANIADLTKLIEPEAQALGLALVRVKMFGGTSDPTLHKQQASNGYTYLENYLNGQ
jgi:ribosome maturation factor RimP